MSYAAIEPGFYKMLTPTSPWHAGSEGWQSAPWPGWGENPNLVGPPRLAVNGLGCGCSGKSVGDDSVTAGMGTGTKILIGCAVAGVIAFIAAKG